MHSEIEKAISQIEKAIRQILTSNSLMMNSDKKNEMLFAGMYV